FHVIQGRGERPLGYLGQRLDLRELASSLAAGSAAEPTSFWLLDPEGHVLIKYGKLLEQPGAEVFPARLDVPSDEGTLAGLGEALWAVRRMEGARPGYVAATVPSSVAFKPLVDSRHRLFKVGGPAVLFVFLMGLVVGRRLVEPILALSQGARKVAAGDLDVQL